MFRQRYIAYIPMCCDPLASLFVLGPVAVEHDWPFFYSFLLAQFGDGWYQAADTPWYLEILPENRFLRILMFAAMFWGFKELLSSKHKRRKESGLKSPGRASGSAPVPPNSPFGSASEWYYHDGQKEIGPFDAVALAQLHKIGLIHPTTLLRRADASQWSAYSESFGQPDPTL